MNWRLLPPWEHLFGSGRSKRTSSCSGVYRASQDKTQDFKGSGRKFKGEMLGVWAKGSVWMTQLVFRSQDPQWRESHEPRRRERSGAWSAHQIQKHLEKGVAFPLGQVGKSEKCEATWLNMHLKRSLWTVWRMSWKGGRLDTGDHFLRDGCCQGERQSGRQMPLTWGLKARSTSRTVNVIQLIGSGGQWLENRL